MESPGPSVPPAAAPANHALVPTAPRWHPGGNAAARPGRAAAGGLDTAGLLRAFGRRWPFALTLGVVLGAGAFAAVFFAVPPPSATATATLHLDPIPRKLLFDLGDRPGDFQNAQLALVKSRLVLNAALRKPNGSSTIGSLAILQQQDDPLEWLEEYLKVALDGSSEIMKISLKSAKHTDDLAVLVNAVTQAYLEEIVDKERIRRKNDLESLRNFALVYGNKVKELRAGLRKLQEQVGSAGGKDAVLLRQEQARIEHDEAVKELAAVRRELRSLRVQVEAYEKGGSPDVAPTPAAVTTAIETDLQLRGQMRKLEIEFEQKRQPIEAAIEGIRGRAVKGDKEPTLIAQRRLLAQVQEAAEKRRKQFESSVAQSLQETARIDSRSRLVTLKQKVTFLDEMERVLVRETDRLAAASKQVVANTLDLMDSQRDLEENEKLLRTLNERSSAILVELEAPSRVQRVDEAVLKKPPELPRRLGFAGGAAFALFALAVFGVSFLEYRAHRVASTGDVVNDLGIQVIGTVPLYRNTSEGTNDNPAYWERRLVDSVDAARTLLLHIACSGARKVIMIASAHAGEGKTSLSGQLAASLARAGRRTLLIDADLRKPALHELFELLPAPGLSEVLRGEVPAAEAVQPTTVPNLSLLAAGSPDQAVFHALARDGGQAVFHALRQEFDFILADSSPILPIPDGLMIAQQTDGVLFSVMERVSRVPAVKAACHRLAMVGAPILGAVVSASREGGAYDYHYGYAYPVAPKDAKPS
jgi:capsular exopolysaccharide synthesis family protein